MTLQNAPPGLDYERDKRFSKVCCIHHVPFVDDLDCILIITVLFCSLSRI